jgi:hypothetical protein
MTAYLDSTTEVVVLKTRMGFIRCVEHGSSVAAGLSL